LIAPTVRITKIGNIKKTLVRLNPNNIAGNKLGILISYLAFAVCISWLTSSCIAPLPQLEPGPRLVQFGHDNYIRNVNFHIPKNLRRKNRSLILCLHDGGSDASGMMRITRRGFNKLSERNNFIVGYPEALDQYWNDGREDSISISHFRDIDDVGLIEKTIAFAIDSFRVEPERVFVAGFSEGGLMTASLACEIPEQIKGFAIVAASLSLDQLVECSPDTTASMIMINGTKDPILPYDGGQMQIDEKTVGSMLAAEEAISFWLEQNECSDQCSLKDIANRDTFDETRSQQTTYSDCKYKNKLVLIKVVNGGHTWPGGRQFDGEKSIGKVSKDFEATQVIWRFFKSL
jgi:polyhydroxybutyrate depolymerase